MDKDTKKLEQEGIEHLEIIEEKLEEIKVRTGSRWISLRNGMYQGAGAVIGSIVGIILIGFLLSALGVIPGLSDVVHLLQEAAGNVRAR